MILGFVSVMILTMVVEVHMTSAKTRVVEVDEAPPAQTLNGYGSFVACPNGSVTNLVDNGSPKNMVAWTCSGSPNIIRYGRI